MNLEIEQLSARKSESQIAMVLSNLKFLVQPYVIASIFLLLYGLFGLIQFNQGREQDSIAAELTKTQRILRKVPQDRQEFEDRLVIAQQDLILERESFPAQQPTNVLLDSILNMASESGVQIINTKIIALREDTIGGILYVVSPFDVQTRGSISQISAFLHQLEDGPLPSILIGTANLSKTDLGFSLGVSFSVYGRAPITDTISPTSRAKEIPSFQVNQGQIQAYVPYVAWDEIDEDETDYSGLDYVELHYKTDDEAEYSKYTTLDNPTGQWTESPIPFTIPSGTTLDLYTIAVDKAGNQEEPPTLGADITTTVESKP